MENSGRRLKRLINIYRVMQFFFFGLLIFMAYNFQKVFQAKGMPSQIFVNSIIAALIIQLILFYPLRKFATAEAQREAAASVPDLDPLVRKSLRSKRLAADLIKVSVFVFFTMFILLAPGATFVMSTAFFCFAIIVLTYAQCFNFALSRLLKERQ